MGPLQDACPSAQKAIPTRLDLAGRARRARGFSSPRMSLLSRRPPRQGTDRQSFPFEHLHGSMNLKFAPTAGQDGDRVEAFRFSEIRNVSEIPTHQEIHLIGDRTSDVATIVQ